MSPMQTMTVLHLGREHLVPEPRKLSIIGAVAAILTIPTALSTQMGGAINPLGTTQCAAHTS